MMSAHRSGSRRDGTGPASEETTGTTGADDAGRAFAEFVTSVFGSWRAHGIAFVVLRNYDTLPASTSNDIDVLVLPKQFRQAERVMLMAAGQAGFTLHNRVRFATTAYFFYHSPTQRQVHVDLYSSLRWHSLPLLPAERVVAARLNRGLCDIPNPLHEALVSLLTRLVYAGHVKEQYKATILAGLRSAPEQATHLLSNAFGDYLARQCVKRSIREQWLGVESLCKDLRRALIRRQLTRHPWKTVSAVVKDSLRLLERLAHSPGLTVILLSEDRMVAPAVGEKLVVSLRDTFNPGRGVHREATALGAGPGEGVPSFFHRGHLPSERTGSLAARLGRSIMSSVGFVLQRRLALFRNGLVLIHGCAVRYLGGRAERSASDFQRRSAQPVATGSDC